MKVMPSLLPEQATLTSPAAAMSRSDLIQAAAGNSIAGTTAGDQFVPSAALQDAQAMLRKAVNEQLSGLAERYGLSHADLQVEKLPATRDGARTSDFMNAVFRMYRSSREHAGLDGDELAERFQ